MGVMTAVGPGAVALWASERQDWLLPTETRCGLTEALELGARPDDLRITSDGTVDATVSLVESFGRETPRRLQVARRSARKRANRRDRTHRLRTGDPVSSASLMTFTCSTLRKASGSMQSEAQAHARQLRTRGCVADGPGAAHSLASRLVAPVLAMFGVFVFYPLVRAIWLGFYQTPAFPEPPVALCRTFPIRFRSLLFALLEQSLANGRLRPCSPSRQGSSLGMALATLANQRIAGIRIFRTIFSSTVATSTAVASVIFFTLLNPVVGLLSYWLGVQGGNGLLENPTWALPAIAVVSIWQNIGFIFILMSAALASIPDDLMDAASVDGASSWFRFRTVTLPLLSPTIFFASVVGIIGSFQAFGQIDLLTQGGPTTTHLS